MDTLDSGPVDLVMLKFPGNHFNGRIAPALQDLVTRDLIRVIDLLFVYKDQNGDVGFVELAGLGPDLEPAFLGMGAQPAGGLLDGEDAEEIGPGLEPNSSVAVIAVENRWAIPFIDAVRDAGGEVVDQARVPADVVAAVRQDLGSAPVGGN